MKKIVNEYIKALSASGLAAKTVAHARRSILDFIASNKIRRPEKIFPEHITAYQELLIERRLSPNTKRTKLTHLRRFIEMLKENGHTLIDASAHIIMPKPAIRLPRRALSVDEIQAILKHPLLNDPDNLRLRAIIEILYGTGIRRAELLNLNLYDIDFRARTLFVREGKFRRDRIVPVPKGMVRYVSMYIEKERSKLAGKDEALFLSKRACRLSDNALQSIMRIFARKVRKHLNIRKPVTCHVFRHSLATHLLACGVDIRYIQALLGHADLTTTEIYTHVEPVHLADELARAHPRDRMKIPLNEGG